MTRKIIVTLKVMVTGNNKEKEGTNLNQQTDKS